MPRRNNRGESVPPLDITPADIPKRVQIGERPLGPRPYWAKPVEDPYLRRRREERERADRQAEARKRDGVDWSVCLVPGCGEDLRIYGALIFRIEDRDPDKSLPLCDHHATVAWRQIQSRKGDPLIMRTTAEVDAELRHRQATKEAEAAARRKADRNGHMYFVRINDLIKIGWTRNLGRRLKEYGAGAELLCHYPAHADEETALHRQLRPSLAKGREWYHHDDVVSMHIADTLKRHGSPRVTADWTEPAPSARDRARVRSSSRPGYYGGVAQR